MLKNCIFQPTNYHNSKFFNRKCGEIICQNENCFAIVCDYCQLKLFDFNDFLQHFHNVHFNNELDKLLLDEPQTPQCKRRLRSGSKQRNNTDVNIKAEEQEEYPITDIDEGEISDLKAEVVLFERPILANIKNKLEADNVELSCDEEDDYVDSGKRLNDEYSEDEEPNESDSSEGSKKALFSEQQNTDSAKTEDAEDEDELDDLPQSIIRQNSPSNKTKAKRHSCEYCGKYYTTAKTLKIHTKIQHLKPKNHKCTQCDEAFLDARSLNSHIKKKHTIYACPHCERQYKNAVSLRVHLLNHKEVKDFVCPYENCGKAFVSKRRLNVHLEVHTDKRNYVCEVCGYRSRSKHALEVHKRGHTGEKPYKCPNCDRYFASKSLVNEHQAMHMTERPYKCDVCDATFARPKALYHHKHLHLSEKKFKCKICGSAYAQAAGLSAHMRQHRMEDAGVC